MGWYDYFMKKISALKIRAVQSKILVWHKKHGRHDLPWRQNPTPYRVLVCEIMLQQTQVSRVIPKYKLWFRHFPSLKKLAHASTREVLQVWSGLGYNRRGLMLRNCARETMARFNGRLPEAYSDLLSLPGIGPYTAHAINIFAQNKNETCIDTNVRRVLIYEFHLPQNVSPADLEGIALKVLPNGKSRLWHSALMDYGSAVATSRKTKITPSGGKQKPFVGSERQVRGAIVRYLGKVPSSSLGTMAVSLKLPRARLEGNAERLATEGLLEYRSGRYRLSRN